MTDVWRKCTLGDVADINPRVPLKRGTVAPFIAMADMAENFGGVARVAAKEFSGGSRFLSGDVLVARITPCLENGKIGRVPAAMADEVGHGSTEFLVVRGIEGEADTAFLAYVLSSLEFLAYAVPRMIGSSGRQRLSADHLAAFPIAVPPIDEQRKIAMALGKIDSLIATERDLGTEIDSLIQELGADLVCRLDDSARIPLPDVAVITKGYSYRSSELGSGDAWLVNLKNMGRGGVFQPRGFKQLNATVDEKFIVENGDILVAQTDLTQNREVIGRPVRVRRGALEGTMVASLDLVVLRPKAGVPKEYLAAVLNTKEFRDHALSHCNGTTVVHMASAALKEYLVAHPASGDISKQVQHIRTLQRAADDAYARAEALTQTRDALARDLLNEALRIA